MPERMLRNPTILRIAPFALYMAFIVIEKSFGFDESGTVPAHTLYVAQMLCTAILLIYVWQKIPELQSPPPKLLTLTFALTVGLAVFVLWRILDQPWARIGSDRPLAATVRLYPEHSGFAAARLLGAASLVPIIEEIFWRSFIMRWVQKQSFLTVIPAEVSVRSLLISSALFGIEHAMWLAGLVAGLAYGTIYRKTGNLWNVILAHALTNALLEFFP
jgi:CAAX prenyl protease-like protein